MRGCCLWLFRSSIPFCLCLTICFFVAVPIVRGVWISRLLSSSIFVYLKSWFQVFWGAGQLLWLVCAKNVVFSFYPLLVLLQVLHPPKDWGFWCPRVILSVNRSQSLKGSSFNFPTYRFYFKSVCDVLRVDLQLLHCFRVWIAFVAPDVPIHFFYLALHDPDLAVFPGSLYDFCLLSVAKDLLHSIGV